MLLVFRAGDAITVRAVGPARFAILGGDALEGPRYIWWNFVSSDRARIEEAKARSGAAAASPWCRANTNSSLAGQVG